MTAPVTTQDALKTERREAERQAWAALARYKFQMFGYWAAIWVHMNRLVGDRQPSPLGEPGHHR